ncbi:hypothetical protein [Methylobacterium sp. CM6247]
MEELVATVSDKDVANYLREALACYGSGAYRACVVLTHIALFDGLRRKVKVLAPVNAVAKSVSDHIEPLADQQKVFEKPLIDKLKTAGIITQLESQILEQLNTQRNKAAHPSGHSVTAEEARFVFSEAIQKFLSLPLRETSYVVDTVMARLADANFFPSMMLPDMLAVVEQELSNLDTAAKPFLFNKLVQLLDSADETTANNVSSFILALASKKDPSDRVLIVKKLIVPKSSNPENAEFFSALITCDPKILVDLELGTKLRVRGLLMTNAKNVGTSLPYMLLRHPAHLLGACVSVLGEAFMLSEMEEFTNWVLAEAPYAPEFVNAVASSPMIFEPLFQTYLARAASSQWSTSNPFASSMPAMDASLAAAVDGEQAFRLIAAIVRGADWAGNGPRVLANSGFSTLPALKSKAKSYSNVSPGPAASILEAQKVDADFPKFVADYLS